MLLLTVDTSSSVVSTALADVDDAGVTVRAVRDVHAANRHGELLAAAIAEVFADAGRGPAELTAVAAGLGPGPFTGLRVGVVTAASMADALGLPTYGVCSLDALARRQVGGQPFLVCTDARRKQVYWARYDAGGARVAGPDIATASALADRFVGDVTVVVGAGAALYADDFAGYDLVEDAGFASAADVAHLVAGRVRQHAPSQVMEPLYLRRPDATPPGKPKSVLPA